MRITHQTCVTCIALSVALSPLTGCSDAAVDGVVASLTKEKDPNGGLFAHEAPNQDHGASPSTPSQPNAPEPTINAQEVAARVAPIAKQNPENRIVRKDTLCSPLLFQDTLNKVMKELSSRGLISGADEFVVGVGVTVMPVGPDTDNLVWKELWMIKTGQKTINYPIVFVGDGVGGTFFIGLEIYES